MGQESAQIRYEGIHCNLTLERLAPHVVVLRITGTDVGEFGDAPMNALSGWITAGDPIEFFIDAREVRGASIEVSGEWAAWMNAHKSQFRSVTMLTGSRFVQVTAEFVRRFASLEGVMRICCEDAIFDEALAESVRRER